MFSRRHPSVWFGNLCRNILKVAPVYWVDYIFKNNYKKHAHCRQIWDATPKVQATGRVEMGGLAGLLAPLSDSARQAIDAEASAVYKLDRRVDFRHVVPGTFLEYLLRTIPADSEGSADGEP